MLILRFSYRNLQYYVLYIDTFICIEKYRMYQVSDSYEIRGHIYKIIIDNYFEFNNR